MGVAERIESDYVQAYKAKETDKIAALRMLKAAIKNLQVELRRTPHEAEVLTVVRKQCKQRLESAEHFDNAGRTEMADQERRELAVLEAYLPPTLSSSELKTLVQACVAELGACSMADMGKVMRAVLDRCGDRVGGQEASDMVKACLQAQAGR
ncbi:MAG: GatB/YqeY domain-containing protein [Deltaproteobacteria bacterium]|nr:GatB/YqeY domain-containing protein [Deltaproteobacteria bacterium]